MNRLTDYHHRPPELVTIDGCDYLLNGNFQNVILTQEALLDDELYDWEKAEIVLENMYSEPYPENINEAVKQAVNYIMQNREVTEADKDKPVFLDFSQDGQLIFDAFLSAGVNLDMSNMTYWIFASHLRELPKDCMFCRIIYLRLQTHRGKLTEDEKTEIQRIGEDVVYLKDVKKERHYSAIDAAFEEYFSQLEQ